MTSCSETNSRTAGSLLSPSTPSAGANPLTQSAPCWPSGSCACPHWGEDRLRDGLEPGLLASYSETQHWKIKQSKLRVKQSLRDRRPPRRSLPALCASASRTPCRTTTSLILSLNWIDRELAETAQQGGKKMTGWTWLDAFLGWLLKVNCLWPWLAVSGNSSNPDWKHYPTSEVDNKTSSCMVKCVVFV